MSRSFPYPERVPLSAVERLLQQFSEMLAALRAAADAAHADEAQAPRLEKAHALLTMEHLKLDREVEDFQAENRDALLQHAWDLRRLARRIDGRRTVAAGEELAAKFATSLQLVVLTAWQITAAATGSEAAGL